MASQPVINPPISNSTNWTLKFFPFRLFLSFPEEETPTRPISSGSSGSKKREEARWNWSDCKEVQERVKEWSRWDQLFLSLLKGFLLLKEGGSVSLDFQDRETFSTTYSKFDWSEVLGFRKFFAPSGGSSNYKGPDDSQIRRSLIPLKDYVNVWKEDDDCRTGPEDYSIYIYTFDYFLLYKTIYLRQFHGLDYYERVSKE